MITGLNNIYRSLLSETAKIRFERGILSFAIIAFIVHLVLIFMVDLNWIQSGSELLENPISAIYTPFSFILLYEVYLLVYYLPRSITTYIAKQYEIITLIIIRRLFKDLSKLELASDWFESKEDLQFTYDLIAAILLFFLLYLFARQRKLQKKSSESSANSLRRFIRLKRMISLILVPVLLGLAIYSLGSWFLGVINFENIQALSFKELNNLFFDEFFTILIIVDVLLLLVSFFYTDEFHKIFRNSGFIISTILIRISFGVEGLTNTALILIAVLFGFLVLFINNLFEKNDLPV